MLLMQMHSKRMLEIEKALATIQLQKTNSETASQQQTKAPTRHANYGEPTFGSCGGLSRSYCGESQAAKEKMKLELAKRLSKPSV